MVSLKRILALASACALIAPVALAAQEPEPAEPTYHLMQLTVQTSEVAPKAFAEKTGNIRSCGEARELAQELNADVKRNRAVPASSLPPMLQNALKGLTIGHATRIFSNNPNTMRVLVLCDDKVENREQL